MKNHLQPVCLLFFLALLFAACKKDNGSLGNPVPVVGSMQATINGDDWKADGAGAGISNGVLVIGGSKADQSGFSIAIDNPQGTGTYQLAPGSKNSGNYSVSASQNGYSTLIGGSGTVVLSSYNGEKAKGTFSFTAMDPFGNSITITNGTFDVNITD